MPYYYITGDNIYFDDFDNNSEMIKSSSNKYCNSYLLYTNLTGEGRYIIINGRNQYDDLFSAQSEDPKKFKWNNLPFNEFIIAYRFIWYTNSKYENNGNCYLIDQPIRLNTSIINTIIDSKPYGTIFDINSHKGLGTQIVTFNNNINLNNINHIINDSKIYIINSGIYSFNLTVQLNGGSSPIDVDLWIRKNGIDLENSNTRNTINVNEWKSVNINILDNAEANDYYELLFSCLNDTAGLVPYTNTPSIKFTIIKIN